LVEQLKQNLSTFASRGAASAVFLTILAMITLASGFKPSKPVTMTGIPL
jgi:hypothetical protein